MTDHGDAHGDPRDDLESLMVDLSELPFEEIEHLPGDVLAYALRSVRESADRPDFLLSTDTPDDKTADRGAPIPPRSFSQLIY
ncbi:hypothetical protein [Streptomyces sp. IB2014 016-6]|uniref:hypothetical protein n=1 Tax=Streptomyces sp. IB2014 016-6 TaxID=2517818 RepID=UPI0011C95EE3|nr:hypothetical protein [Streptomyces sp. IB2014 016-6]TXL88414.1 hypothetical protein EW053_18685 [Streptomyces sp. IB2014 016-6]